MYLNKMPIRMRRLTFSPAFEYIYQFKSVLNCHCFYYICALCCVNDWNGQFCRLDLTCLKVQPNNTLMQILAVKLYQNQHLVDHFIVIKEICFHSSDGGLDFGYFNSKRLFVLLSYPYLSLNIIQFCVSVQFK